MSGLGDALGVPALSQAYAPSASAPPGLVLDTYAALGAYSIYRKLRSTATLAFKVVRSSDSTSLDVGFSGNYVDMAAAIAFCAGSTGIVDTWYDQSGNSRNVASTTTARPRIIISGAADLLGATAPGITFDGSSNYLSRADTYGLSGNVSITIASALKVTDTSKKLYTVGTTGGNGSIGIYTNSASTISIDHSSTAIQFAMSPNITTAFSMVQTHTAGDSVIVGGLRQNGAARTPGSTSGAGAMSISGAVSVIGGHSNVTFLAQMKLGSWMIFNSVLSGAGLTAVETELAAHLV